MSAHTPGPWLAEKFPAQAVHRSLRLLHRRFSRPARQDRRPAMRQALEFALFLLDVAIWAVVVYLF